MIDLGKDGKPHSMLELGRSLPKALFSVKALAKNVDEVIAATIRSKLFLNSRVPVVSTLLRKVAARYEGVRVRLSAMDYDVERKMGLQGVWL